LKEVSSGNFFNGGSGKEEVRKTLKRTKSGGEVLPKVLSTTPQPQADALDIWAKPPL